MKKLLFLILLFLPSLLWAADPYIACDIYTDPGKMPTSFEYVIVDSNDNEVMSGENVYIEEMYGGELKATVCNISSLPEGTNYKITVKAKNERGTSEASILDFFLTGIPGTPAALGVFYR